MRVRARVRGRATAGLVLLAAGVLPAVVLPFGLTSASAAPPACAVVVSSRITPSVVRGGDGAMQTVTLSRPARYPFTFVDLTSSDRAYHYATYGVRGPGGQRSVTFPVRFDAVARQLVERDNIASSADCEGPDVAANPVTVRPLDPAELAVESLTFSRSTGAAGEPIRATIRLTGPARSRGTGVFLYQPQYFGTLTGYPYTAVVPAGSRTLTLDLTVLRGIGISTLVGDLGTSRASGEVLTFDDHLEVTGRVRTGTSQALVGLGGPAPAGGAVVHVSTDQPGLHVPATVTVPAGARGVPFRIRLDEGVDPFGGHLTVRYAGRTSSADLFLG